MSDKAPYKTLTMARIQEDQENWSQAAVIYRHLLQNDPADENIQAALVRVESKMRTDPESKPDGLVQDFERWLDLVLRQKKISQLKRLQAYLKP